MHTMTKRQGKSGTIDIKAVLAEDEEFLRAVVRMALQAQILEERVNNGRHVCWVAAPDGAQMELIEKI
jgi:hypothetical protein